MSHLMLGWVLEIDDGSFIITNTNKHDNNKNVYSSVQILDSQHPMIGVDQGSSNPRLNCWSKWQQIYNTTWKQM